MDTLVFHCICDETFFTICGHVITKIEHNSKNCPRFDRSPYIKGQQLEHFCDSWYFNLATIKNSSCKFCLNDNYHPSNEWRSDMIDSDQNVSHSEIRERGEYWTSYIEEQRKLFQRQENFENDVRISRQNLGAIGVSPNGIRSGFVDLGWKFVVSRRRAAWYLAQQIYELYQIRSMMPVAERLYFFDESNVNTDILAPVLTTDIPRDAICGICREFMHDTEISRPNGICRTFCGHVYHHDCIVRWFSQAGGLNVTCPICRQRRSLIRLPLGEWEHPWTVMD